MKPSLASAHDSSVLLVDYDGLYRTLNARIVSNVLPADFIDEITYGVRKHLLEKIRSSAARAIAYADFSDIGDRGLQQALFVEGSEPRYVPTSFQTNAAEVQLTIDALDTVYCQPEISTFLIVTGENLYLPLVQKLHAHAKRVLVIMPDPPSMLDDIAFVQGNVYVDALGFVSEATRRSLDTYATASVSIDEAEAIVEAEVPVYKEISSTMARQTLEIIEEHFGQYDEIYLTPLLRKLSDEMDSEAYDPKTIIGELEDAGAVALEKRKGFPYDYTVLIVDGNHPEVLTIQQAFQATEAEDYNDEDDYWNESYTDADEDAPYASIGEPNMKR